MANMKQNFARLHATTVRQKHSYIQNIFWLEWKTILQKQSFESINICIFLPGKTEYDLVKKKIELKLHFILGYKCSLCLQIYVHDRKRER